ncbi:hypothetical protein ACFSHP_26555 [Novosphingobium panipatense]
MAPPIVPAAMSPILAGLLFAWMLGVVLWSAFGVVHEAEELAEMLGEPSALSSSPFPSSSSKSR